MGVRGLRGFLSEMESSSVLFQVIVGVLLPFELFSYYLHPVLKGVYPPLETPGILDGLLSEVSHPDGKYLNCIRVSPKELKWSWW
jgi:hypothetical protein